jgi:molybdopterin molybdotransferase
MALLPVQAALSRILDGVDAIQDVETVPLRAAAGRVLAEAVIAQRDQPPFPASAMDGYAVRLDDAGTPGARLAVVGKSSAGHRYGRALAPGEAVRIFTGAPVPEGADAILIQENATADGERHILVTEPPSAGRFIRPAGLDFRAGETLIAAGTRLDAGWLTLAASANCPSLPVRRWPRVAILATGDELVQPGETPGPDQIIASNTVGIAALLRDIADLIDLGIVRDDLDATRQIVSAAIDDGVDVLVTLGGASVGDHDYVQAALVGAGMTLDFWKIAMRPGKPLMSGRLGATHVIGLPGNPVSSLVCSHVFVKPLVQALAGLASDERRATAILARDLPANDERQDYIRARLTRDADGRWAAEPFERQDSSMMRIFAIADALIIRPPHAPALAKGSDVAVMLLR